MKGSKGVMSTEDCATLEKFIVAKRDKEEAEMMADFIHHNFFELQPWEVAQAIREGVTSWKTIEEIVGKL